MAIFPFWQRKSISKALQDEELPEDVLEQWEQFNRKAEDHELYCVNPRYLAEKLHWSEERLLDVLSLSVAKEIWELEWDAYCPACNHVLQQADSMAELEQEQYCPYCQQETPIHLDEQVTPRASVVEAVRRLNPARRDDDSFRAQVDEDLGHLPALRLVNRKLFREKLGTRALPPNHSIGVGHLAVFFSDLKASTKIYQNLGDGKAYQLVRQHFDAIFSAVEQQDGTAVKTIGDGVMGTFLDNASALRGAVNSVKAVRALNREAGLEGEERLRLKVGLHAGPCIVVTLNGRLDYFGSTVNIAARLSDLAQGDDVWLSKAVLEHPDARQVVDEINCEREDQVTLRGIAEEVDVCRLQI
jgi:class 3 adenylate cyclase/phage FluMu protein Com